MLINHPLLGPRDISEFTYLGDASLMVRPDGGDNGEPKASVIDAFHDYVYLRDNPCGEHRELWYHEHGDKSWLIVTRNTLSHEIINVALAHKAKTKGTTKSTTSGATKSTKKGRGK